MFNKNSKNFSNQSQFRHKKQAGFVRKERSDSNHSDFRPSQSARPTGYSYKPTAKPSFGNTSPRENSFQSYSPRSAPSNGPRFSSPSRGGMGGGFRGGFGGGFRGGNRGGGFGSQNRGGSGRKPMRGERIDFAKFIHKPTATDAVKPKTIEVKHTFADFDLNPILQNNLKNKGYTSPTPIQDQTIAHAMLGQDVLGLANTGSGKTAAFLLPLIDKVSKDPKQKVMILAPTRELAMQIEAEFREFAQGMKLFSTLCVGGMPIFRQIQNLKMINHFIIGTPGRIKDLSDRRCINYAEFNNVVLDEVDHMLDMGFVDEITDILKGLSPDKQSLFFSATMPIRIKNLVQKFQNNPFTVDIVVPGSTKSVEQDIIRTTRENKFQTLCDLLKGTDVTRTIIFVETKREVDDVTDSLREAGFRSGSLHGDKRQRERARTLDNFKKNNIDILVATDVAARGIDVKDVSHVINYTIPQTHDSYVHRIGRAGRAGKTGKAFTFVS